MQRVTFLAFSLVWYVGAADVLLAQTTQGLKDQLAPIVKAQDEAKAKFYADLKGKSTEGAQQPVIDLFSVEVARNTNKVLELVRSNPADPAIVEALKFVILTAGGGPGAQSTQAMEILLRDHVRDPGMGDLCGRIFHFTQPPVAEALLRAVVEKHPSRADRGLACKSLAELLTFRADMIRQVRQGKSTADRYLTDTSQESGQRLTKLINESDLEALDRDSVVLYERIVAEYSDVKDWFSPDRTIGEMARGELFNRRNLAVGQVIPEITGKDHEGKTFSLSDYRGKVVVLTFSASWCGPCVGMYPHDRELVKKLEGRPFAFLSVHSDENVGKLKQSIASGEITWRCWWDEGVYGPITTHWGILAIPETFLIDRAGIIRDRNLRGGNLEKAVMALLDEPRAVQSDSR